MPEHLNTVTERPLVPGFRYHVATIAAIFLALGVGIIIGSSFVQSAIVERQTRRLEELNAQFSNQVVVEQERNRQYAGFIEAFYQRLKGRLAGVRVALVQTGDYPEAVQKAREALEHAGATVASVTLIDSGFPTRAETNLATVLPKLRAAHPNLPAEAASLLRVLALAMARGGPESDLTALADVNLIQWEGDYSRPNDYVVLVGGASEERESRAERLDAPLIAQLKTLGVGVLFVEPKEAALSYIPLLGGSEVTTVDSADTDIGRVALILAFRAARGDYGIKRTARSGLLPPSSPLLP